VEIQPGWDSASAAGYSLYLNTVKLTIPKFSLVLLVGPAGCGKSTFGSRHFKTTEVISSDSCRALVSDDENDQSASRDAFDVLQFIAAKRLAAGRLTVIDATNVQKRARASLLALARRFHAPAVAIVFNLTATICVKQDRARPDRHVGPEVIRKQAQDLRHSLASLDQEGFWRVYIMTSPAEAATATVARQRGRAGIGT
jgi:protein phosphatase